MAGIRNGGTLKQFISFLALTLFLGNAAAATRYVGACGTPTTATIAAAVAAAGAGDSILICPGTYTEAVTVNKDNLTLRGSTGNRADVTVTNAGIPFTLTGANITLKDMTVWSTSTSTNYSAVSRDWTASPSAYTFENLAITARGKGVSINVSAKVSFTNVTVSSSNDDAIYLSGGSNGAHVFDTVNASAPNGYGIYSYNGGATFKDITVTSKEHALNLRPAYDATFTNINATSSNGGGLYMAWVGTGKALTFTGINVNAKEKGIYIEVSALVSLTNVTVASSNNDAIRLEGATRGAHVFDTITATGKNYGIYTYNGGGMFKDLTVTSQNHAAIYLRPNYDASFSNITATSSNNHGIYMEWVASGKALDFSNVNVTAKNKGVYVDVAGALSFRDMVVSSSDSHAIHLGWAASGAHVFNNLTLDAKESGILLDDSAPSSTISNVCVNSGKYGVNVAQWHARNVAISNSKFTNTTYGVRVEADTSYKTTVSNSCFIKSSTPRAYSNSTTHRFTGNYWQGVAGGTSYSDGNVRDAGTLASCPVTSCYSGAAALTPIGEWRLEETSWNGTAGEVRDSGGNNLHGKAIGSPKPAPVSASPARAGNPGTCGYGSFAGPAANGGAIELSGLPVSTVAGAKTTVSFWMYWNGGDNMMPIGWNTHDLWLVSGSFGFNTGNSDVFGIASAGLANRWVHVAAVFTNGSVTGNALYIDGVQQSLTQRRSTPNNTTAKVQSTLRISGWQRDNNYRFNGRIDEVRVYNGELTAGEVATLVGETHECAASTEVCTYPIYAGGSLSVGNDSEINNHDISGSGNAIDPDTGARSTATQTLGALSPASFPSFSGGADYSGSASSLTPGTTYDDVTLTSGTAPTGTYYMDTLTLNGTVTFGGGTYYVNTLSIDKEENISFTAATDFRINTQVNIDKEVDLRASGAAVGSVPARFYLYGSADFIADKEGRMDGIVVAAGAGNSITFDKEWEITGALITPGAIAIGKDTELTYNAAVVAALSSSGICGGGSVVPTPPAGFNCVEVGANASSGHLYTKLVGTNFNFDIVALKADGSTETAYAAEANKAVTVELVDGSGSTACGSRAARVAWPGQTFTSAAAGRITASAASAANAYANLRCRVSDGSVTGCSTDNFSVRPSVFTLTSTANADAAGSNAAVTPTVKTGTGFTLTATAVAGYDATPVLDSSKAQAHAGASQTGALAGSFGAANAATGVATGSGFSYSEVGYFRLAANGVADTGFTSVDAANGDCSADFSNTAVSGKYGCYFGNSAATNYFGRFTPDHFALTPGALTQGCGNFTYYGQDFSTAFTLEALNSANGITRNYHGNYARLGLSDWNNFGFAAAGATLLQGATPPLGSWSNGSADVTAAHRAARDSSGAPQAMAALEVAAQVVDSDGVTMSALAVATAAAPHRTGRLRIANTVGSEMLALPVPLTAQYWNDTGFVTNSDDNCTVLSAPTLTFYVQSVDNRLASGETTASFNATLNAGNGNLRLSAPGVNNFGYLDLLISAPDWLKYNWDGVDQSGDGNLFDDNPRARATFGKRKGSDKVIIRREIY